MLQAIPVNRTVGIRPAASRTRAVHDHVGMLPSSRSSQGLRNINDGDRKRPPCESGSGFLRCAQPEHAPSRLQKETGCGFPEETAAGDNNLTPVQCQDTGLKLNRIFNFARLALFFALRRVR